MDKCNIIDCCNKSDRVCTREVLFEKYNPYLTAVMLTDLNTWGYPNIDVGSVDKSIEYLKDKIEKKRFVGEFLHGTEHVSLDIHLSNVSHSIENVFLKDRKIYGKITVFDTPSGRIVKELTKNKFEMKFRIRATGHINAENSTEVDEIITWDILM